MSTITEDEWYTKYKPVANHIDPDASWSDGDNGLMFETYGEEVQYVLSQVDNNTVWTYMDSDNGGTCVVAGYYLVNRIGYFVTEVPWEDEDIYFTVLEGEEPEND